MGMTIRLDENVDQALGAIAHLEHTSKNALVNEAVELLVRQRLESPEFQKKIDDHIMKPLGELIKTLEL